MKHESSRSPLSALASRSFAQIRTPNRSTLAILDQAVVSGGRLAITLLIGRYAGAEELGWYTAVFVVHLMFAAAVDAFVVSPFTVYHVDFDRDRERSYAGSTLLLTVIIALVAALVAIVLSLASTAPQMARALLGLAVACVPLLLWEFARRHAIAQLQMPRALMLDSAVMGAVVVGILFNVWRDTLTAQTAYVAIGLGCTAGLAGWWVYNQSQFSWDRQLIWEDFQQNAGFGRWVIGGQLVAVSHGYAPAMILLILIGPEAAGTFAACENVILISNPLVLAITNLVAATSARAHREGQSGAVRLVVFKAATRFGLLMTAFALLVSFAGPPVIQMLFGSGFEIDGRVISILACGVPIIAVSNLFAVGLRACRRLSSEFKARLAGCITTLAIAFPAAKSFGLSGIAVALVVGALVTVVCQFFALLSSVATSESAPHTTSTA